MGDCSGTTHYRNPLDWNINRLTQARQTLGRWYAILAKTEANSEIIQYNNRPDEKILVALRDDLNISMVLKRLHELVALVGQATTAEDALQAASKLRASAGLVGLLQQPAQLALNALIQEPERVQSKRLQFDQIEVLIYERNQARKNYDSHRADTIRQHLAAASVDIHDTPEGTKWMQAGEVLV